LDYHNEKEELCKTIKKRSERYIKAVRCKPGASQMFKYVGNAYGDRRKVLSSADDDVGCFCIKSLKY